MVVFPRPPSLSTFSTFSFLLLVASHILPTTAEYFALYGHSQPAQTHLTQLSQNQVCPVSTDGITSTSFPWTHNPPCIDVEISSTEPKVKNTRETICVYTNSLFANNRGISLITTPEVATSYVLESFSHDYEEDRDPEELSYEKRDTEGRGIGLFAKKEMEAGDTIMTKHPVLILHKDLVAEDLRSIREHLLHIAIRQLPASTTTLFTSLAKSMGGNPLDDVVHTNSIGMVLGVDSVRGGGGRQHLGVVPEAARINHACRPNAYYRIDDYELKLEVFALKTIKPGEELTFSYGYSRHPHTTRQTLIKENWGFTCTCPLCTSPPSVLTTSDSRLSEISSMKSMLPNDAAKIPELIALLPKLIKLLEEEGLVIERPMYEEILAYSYSTVGSEEKARYWAKRAREAWEVVAGRSSYEVKRTRDLEVDVRNHGTWDTWEGEAWSESEDE